MPVAQGRAALVTGTSRGLGPAIARRLARDGLAVAVNGRPGDRAGEVARSIGDGGGIAQAFYADVTDEEQVAGLVAAITGRFGPVDVLVLNATGPQTEAPAPRWPGLAPSRLRADGPGWRSGPRIRGRFVTRKYSSFAGRGAE